jgi:hypothetical protein
MYEKTVDEGGAPGLIFAVLEADVGRDAIAIGMAIERELSG